MIRFFLAASVALLTVDAHAQVEKGTMVLGGSFMVNSDANTSESYFFGKNVEKTESFSMSIAPNYGFFLADNLSVGISLSAGRETFQRKVFYGNAENVDILENTTNNIYGAGVYVRKFWNLNEKLLAFGSFSVNYYTSKGDRQYVDEFNSQNISLKGQETIGTISPGLMWLVTDKLGLELSYGNLFYSFSRSESGAIDSKRQQYGVDMDLSSLRIGANFYF